MNKKVQSSEKKLLIFYGKNCHFFIRVIYDRVRNRKNYFEIAAFLNFEQGTSRAEKFKVMLQFAATEMFVCVFFSFEFPAIEVPHSKLKKASISK